MRPFQLNTSPILTVTYIDCNLEMGSNMYRGALGQDIGAIGLVLRVVVEW